MNDAVPTAANRIRQGLPDIQLPAFAAFLSHAAMALQRSSSLAGIQAIADHVRLARAGYLIRLQNHTKFSADSSNFRANDYRIVFAQVTACFGPWWIEVPSRDASGTKVRSG